MKRVDVLTNSPNWYMYQKQDNYDKQSGNVHLDFRAYRGLRT